MPVMSFSAPIVSLSKVKKGENLGYGCDHIAKKDTYTATVSAGYANGLARMAERGFKPCLNGVRVPFAARICMDRCILDITELVMRGVNVRVYDEVEFFGDKASVLELALSENTIPYEALCRVGLMNEKEFLERKS